jgi:hypothetical protein
VSVDFGNDHLYVAGATTVDSFVLHQNSVEGLDVRPISRSRAESADRRRPPSPLPMAR